MNTILNDTIIAEIAHRGGWVNAHAHFDRAYTVNKPILDQAHQLMEEKWTLTDKIRKSSSEEDYAARIEQAVQAMIMQGVSACATFVDADPLCELRAIRAAVSIKKKYERKIQIRLISHTSKGILDHNAKQWAQKALPYVDIIGGLPSIDRPNHERHLDTIFSWAKETGKIAHVHIDQENNPDEHDTELLAKKTIEHGLEGKVVAVHAISIACQPKEKRKEMYAHMNAAGLSVVCCPSAAINMKQIDAMAPIHNCIAPVVELLEAGIPVALGTDNIADIYCPLVDGDMYTELRFLAEACRFYDLEKLVEIATTSGRNAIGIS